MVSPSLFVALEQIAARLPFHLNDTDQVNETFHRWRQQGHAADREIVEIWTYCFTRRYFLIKFTRDNTAGSASDLDRLVEKAYERAHVHQQDVQDDMKYAQWVSVICRNAYLNHRRKQRPLISIDQENGPKLLADDGQATHDIGILAEGTQQAIARLPDYLQDVAHMRLLQELPYTEIAHRVDKSLPIVRAYVHKAIVKIREDPVFLVFVGRSDPE